jgi:hypothetical protein
MIALVKSTTKKIENAKKEKAEKQNIRPSDPIILGTLVLARYPNDIVRKHLQPRLRGPFKIVKQLPHSCYTLEHCATGRITDAHISALVTYDDSLTPDIRVPASADTYDEYLVEDIVSHRGKATRLKPCASP